MPKLETTVFRILGTRLSPDLKPGSQPIAKGPTTLVRRYMRLSGILSDGVHGYTPLDSTLPTYRFVTHFPL